MSGWPGCRKRKETPMMTLKDLFDTYVENIKEGLTMLDEDLYR